MNESSEREACPCDKTSPRLLHFYLLGVPSQFYTTPCLLQLIESSSFLSLSLFFTDDWYPLQASLVLLQALVLGLRSSYTDSPAEHRIQNTFSTHIDTDRDSSTTSRVLQT